MKINEASDKSGLSKDTLRYYEKIGLLQIKKDKSGHREYTEANIASLAFIHCLKMTGMPLKIIRQYVDLRDKGDCTIQARMDLLTNHELYINDTIVQWANCLHIVQDKIKYYQTLKNEK